MRNITQDNKVVQRKEILFTRFAILWIIGNRQKRKSKLNSVTSNNCRACCWGSGRLHVPAVQIWYGSCCDTMNMEQCHCSNQECLKLWLTTAFLLPFLITNSTIWKVMKPWGRIACEREGEHSFGLALT